MEAGKKEVSLETLTPEKVALILKEIFLKRGYPEDALLLSQVFTFSYGKLRFHIEVPLMVKTNSKVLMVVDYKPSQKGLTSFERGLLALARVLFDPVPVYALLTNFSDYILIETLPVKFIRGNEDLIPSYSGLLSYRAPFEKPFKPELEKKILAIYLSGG
jgi:hypothetical protein